MNLLLWTDTLHDGVLPVLDEIKRIGYDAVEAPIFEADVEKYAAWGRRLDDVGLARTGVTICGVDNNPMSPDAAVRRKGIDWNKAALDCCVAMGAETLCGPYHSALGFFSGAGPTDDEWKWAVESMQKVAEHAAACKVKLGIEYLNRFECYLLNTAADGARFVRDVNHPSCMMMYDTFHSHIEEKSTPAAIRALKDCLIHVHISENDRSTPGKGNIRWAETFDTLSEIGYDNLMVVEAFGLALEKLVPATKIWRRMYQNETQLATDALRFMKSEVGKRASSKGCACCGSD
jgi:D-psicose/D-tagatose/L-ribulose 3-epimerase